MKKTYRNFAGIYFFYYFALAAISALIAPYLVEIGLSGVQIGSITGTGALVGVIATPVWGNICDRIGKNKILLYILLLGSSSISVFILFRRYYLYILLIYAVFFVFHNPIFAIMDSYTLKFDYEFGNIRLWGSIGYAIGVFITGLIVGNYGLHYIFYVYSVGGIIAFLFLRNITKEEDKAIQCHGSTRGKDLFYNKKYVLFVIASFCTQGPMLAHNTYFSLLYTKVGGTIAGVGAVLMLFCLSEAPFMKIFAKVDGEKLIEKMFIVLLVISASRWFIYSLEPTVNVLIASFLLHGISNGAFIVTSIIYIAKITKKENRVTALSLYSALSLGLANMFCQYAGGIILDQYGPGGVYVLFTLLNVIAVALFIVLMYFKKEIIE